MWAECLASAGLRLLASAVRQLREPGADEWEQVDQRDIQQLPPVGADSLRAVLHPVPARPVHRDELMRPAGAAGQ